jgi:hypothetical protein
MKARLVQVALVLSLALVGTGCIAAPASKPAEGPSPFLAGFSTDAVVASMNAGANDPRCPTTSISRSHSAGGSSGGWSEAALTTTCADPGDGTALRQAWSAGIAAELSRLGAVVTMKDEATMASGATITSRWEYESGGLRGQVTVGVLPAPDGQYWVTVRIVEPS